MLKLSATQSRWVLQVLAGLLLNGSGLCLLAFAAHNKYANAGEWFYSGSLALVLVNSGVCLVVDARSG